MIETFQIWIFIFHLKKNIIFEVFAFFNLKVTEQFFNYVCSLTLIPRDFGLELMRCFLAKTKENAKPSSNIKFSHSCKSWREIFECFPKILLREKETIKVVRRLRLFVIIRQCCMYTIPLVCFVIFHWIYALLLNLFQKDFVL